MHLKREEGQWKIFGLQPKGKEVLSFEGIADQLEKMKKK